MSGTKEGQALRGTAVMTDSYRKIAVLAIFLLSACSNGPNSKFEDFGDRVNTRDFGHKYAQPENADELVMGPGDTINIQIANNPALSGTQPVGVSGGITMPFVDTVKVAGLTPAQIRDKIEILLSPYIRDVTVQVVPISIISKRVYIFARDADGALQIQTLPMAGDMTLLDMFAAIGGVPILADDCHVKVIRGDPLHPKTLNINVRDMVLNGYTGGNIQMRPDDIVFLPPTFWARLAMGVREVFRPVTELSRSLSGIVNLATGGGGRGRGRSRGF